MRLRVLNRLFAAIALMVILAAAILVWPVESIGLRLDPETHLVAAVAPSSAAAAAGIMPGDRIVEIYGHPVNEVVTRGEIYSWLAASPRHIDGVLVHGDQTVPFTILRHAPTISDYISLTAVTGLALVCWLTGFVLGIRQPNDVLKGAALPLFWLCISIVFGTVTFTEAFSVPGFVILLWTLVTILSPWLVSIHLRYPVLRLAPSPARCRLATVVSGTALLLVGCGIAVLGSAEVVGRTYNLLLRLLPFTVCSAIGLSALILVQAYRRTTIQHQRRQIRLIGGACLFILSVWLLLRVGPILLDVPIPGGALWLIGSAWTLPLAYLVGRLIPDLYRLDQLLLHLLIHLAAFSTLAVALAGLTVVLALQPMTRALWGAVMLVVGQRPLYRVLRYLFFHADRTQSRQHAIEETLTGLTTTLDAARLANILCAGIDHGFGRPAYALFIEIAEDADALGQVGRQQFGSLPTTIPCGTFLTALRAAPLVAETTTLRATLQEVDLAPSEQHFLDNPAIDLWCVIRQSKGRVIGLLVLGPRPDLEPYRPEDVKLLQRLIAAATLAFNHSAALVKERKSETIIRELYNQRKNSEAESARSHAREIHDEILNGYVRLNIQRLERLVAQPLPDEIIPELQLLLESEQGLSNALRMLSENLHPTGIEDAFGFSAVLRIHIDQLQAQWAGTFVLHVNGDPLPLAPQVQREALRIVKEALINVQKHAVATNCSVTLDYLAQPSARVHIQIADNGTTNHVIRVRPGHLGVRGMEESAYAIGGQLRILKSVGGGTTVTLDFPVTASEEEQRDGSAHAA